MFNSYSLDSGIALVCSMYYCILFSILKDSLSNMFTIAPATWNSDFERVSLKQSHYCLPCALRCLFLANMCM